MLSLPDLSSLSSKQKDELIRCLFAQHQLLLQRINDLEAQLAKNSSNSSQPPSSDGFKRKTKSLRERGKNAPGGQRGHPGATLKRVAAPDEIVVHPAPARCDLCGRPLAATQVEVAGTGRQVIDLPPIRIKIVEHRLQTVRCRCGKVHCGRYPQELTQAVQYGPALKASLVYLTQYQHVPIERCAQAMQDLFGVHLSTGSVQAAITQAAARVAPVVEALAAGIRQAPVAHFDETGIRVQAKLYWQHSASTQQAVCYGVHARRGWPAMQELGILPQFNGIAIHDGWPSYYRFEGTHGLCNAHHLRELLFVFESTKQPWARQMMHLLVEIKDAVQARAIGRLKPAAAAAYRDRYRALLEQGRQANPERLEDPSRRDKRGGIKQTTTHNLLRRLERYEDDVLRFMTHALVPFENNLAERDIRMNKVKQKVSGGFRSLEGAKAFCVMRSYLGTLRKQGKDLMAGLTDVFRGHVPAVG